MKTRLVTYDDVEYGDIFTRVGFGYAPIGTIIYRDGNTVPNGFLLCDGSTKSISSYPDLATYFQTTHGRKNYYGGNGSSTFGLPLYCGMPGGRIYESTTEHIVSVDKDRKPIYEKTIVDTLPATETNGVREVKQISIGANISRITAVSSFAYSSTGVITPLYGSVLSQRENDVGYQVRSNAVSTNNNSISVFNANKTWNEIDVVFTIRYTKPSDSAVPAGYSPDRNGIWCIKATTDPTN